MTLYETLQALHVAAQAFKGGTAITPDNVLEHQRHQHAFSDLVQMAKRKGATPYQIVSAYAGDIDEDV